MATANLIREMLEEELDRNARAQAAYEAERQRLPKGSIAIKHRGDRTYCYLKYRDGARIVTDYVGPTSKAESELKEKVNRRKEIEMAIKQLKEEQSYIKRALAL